MKQQVWSSPKTTFEQFVPQVYCKNCSADDNTKTTYKFVCNAGSSTSGYQVFQETNGETGLQNEFLGNNNDTRLTNILGSYSPCEETHTVEVTGTLTEANLNTIFPKGYMVRGDNVTEVRIWTENGTNVHCTEALNVSEFQLAKS